MRGIKVRTTVVRRRVESTPSLENEGMRSPIVISRVFTIPYSLTQLVSQYSYTMYVRDYRSYWQPRLHFHFLQT